MNIIIIVKDYFIRKNVLQDKMKTCGLLKFEFYNEDCLIISFYSLPIARVHDINESILKGLFGKLRPIE